MSGVSPATFTPSRNIKRGQDWSFTATFTDAAGAALNLTGWTVEAQVWDLNRTSKIADFVVSFPSGRTTGVVKFALTKLQTPALLDESYYDVALTDTSTIKEFYLEGILPAEEGYTR
jgi:hypothetical protein